MRLLLFSYFRICHGVVIRGVRNIPLEGPVLIAPNHTSFYDSQLTGFAVPRPIYFMAHAKYFKWCLGWLISSLRGYPIEIGSRRAYATMLRLLEEGRCLVIYPEGTRSKTGEVGPLQDGVARMALTTGATIVPMTIVGAHDAWPPRQKFPKFCRRIVIKYHKPILLEKVENKTELKRRIPEINEQLNKILTTRVRAWRKCR